MSVTARREKLAVYIRSYVFRQHFRQNAKKALFFLFLARFFHAPVQRSRGEVPPVGAARRHRDLLHVPLLLGVLRDDHGPARQGQVSVHLT